MRKPFLPLLVLILCLAGEARAQEFIYVKFPAVLAPGAAVGERVLDECQPEDRLGATILNSVLRIHNNRTRVASGAGNAGDKVFELTILNVLGAGGGAYSGAKTLHVRADIVQNGTVLATREFERRTKKSVTRGTCSLLDIAAKDLGREVAMWLPAASELTGAGVARSQSQPEQRAEPVRVADPAERMRQLKQMRDEGLIDDKEYEQKRVELLKSL